MPGVIGDDSGQMVDRSEVDVVDRHPETIVVLAGINDVSSDLSPAWAWPIGKHGMVGWPGQLDTDECRNTRGPENDRARWYTDQFTRTTRSLFASSRCCTRRRRPTLARLNDLLKAHGLTFGDALNLALFVLTLVSLWLAWQGVKIARDANTTADQASKDQSTLFQQQLIQQQKATIDLDRLQKRFDAIDSRQPLIEFVVYCPARQAPFQLSTDPRFPVQDPNGVIEVDAQGRGNCQIQLDNMGTDAVRGVRIFVAVHTLITGLNPPVALLSNVPRGPKPHLSFNGYSLDIGPFGTISIATYGQGGVSPWFALKVPPTVQKIALLVRATAQNAVPAEIYPTISITRDGYANSRKAEAVGPSK